MHVCQINIYTQVHRNQKLKTNNNTENITESAQSELENRQRFQLFQTSIKQLIATNLFYGKRGRAQVELRFECLYRLLLLLHLKENSLPLISRRNRGEQVSRNHKTPELKITIFLGPWPIPRHLP